MAYSSVQQTHNQQNQNCCVECDMKFDTEKSLNVHLQYHQKNLMNKWGGKPNVGGDESNNNSHKTGNNNARVRTGDFSSPVMAPADSSDSMVKTELQTSGAPGRPSSSSSTTYSRGSPPASTSFTYPPTPGSYSSAPSPYQPENHRFSPAGAHQQPGYSYQSANRTEHTPPPMMPLNSVQNNFQGLVGSSLSFSAPEQSRHPVDENAHFFHSGQPIKEEPGYIFGSGNDFPMLSPNVRSSTPSSVLSTTPSSTSMTPTSSSLRYHPYQNIAVSHNSQQNSYIQSNLSRDLVTTSRYAPSPSQNSLQCEKCGFQCSSSSVLLDHINIAHRAVPMLGNHQVFMQQQNHGLFSHRHDASVSLQSQHHLQRNSQETMQGMFADFRDPGGTNNNRIAGNQPKVEDETPAEILDLDSHKVHVYQPPPEEEEALRAAAEVEEDGRSSNQNPHSVSAMLWGNGASPSNLHRSYRPMNVSQTPEFGSVPTSLTPPTPVTSDVTVPQPTTYQPHRTYLQNPDDIHNNPNMPRVSPTHQAMITSTQLPHTNAVSSTLPSSNTPVQTQSQQKGSKGDASWKSNEARRPKTYNCSACNKWFTSSGHLKRHYNTTLHKNAVKQSGAPDPAAVPVSQHHHPSRELSGGSGPIMHRITPVPGGTGDSSSPAPSLGGEDSSRSDDAGQTNNSFGRMTPQQPASSSMLSSSNSQIPESPPNRLAGPSAEISGGLQFLSTYNSTQEVSSVRSSLEALPPHVTPQHLMLNTVSPPVQSLVPQSALGSHLIHHPIPQQPRHLNPSMTAFPNGLPPHVSTTQTQISTNQHHLTTSIGSQAGSPALANVAGIDDVPNHLLLGNNAGAMTGFFPSSTPSYPLPSFSQLHQNHLFSSNSGNTLTLLQGFNGMSQYHHPASGYHLVSTLENVGGLSLSPNSQILMDIHSLSNAENSINYLGLEDSELDLKSEDMDSKISSTEKHMNGLSDSNASVGDNISILSPIGTPDYPTSTTEDLEQDVIKLSFNNDDHKHSSAVDRESGRKVNDCAYVSSVSNSTLPKCVACDKVFNKACYLTQHNKSFHSGHKPFKCPRCGKRFDSEVMYQEHQGKHAGDKPFKCEICPKQFNHKTDLRRHLCLHTGEKPYSCDTCGKGFIRKDHMLKHTETHRKKTYNNNNNFKNKNITHDELSSQIVTSNDMELEQLAISAARILEELPQVLRQVTTFLLFLLPVLQTFFRRSVMDAINYLLAIHIQSSCTPYIMICIDCEILENLLK
ncbi:uncharacterized protein LOC134532245 [Bacillus rossius redtenbacheri]|uniref:uncharacterized protein LOC134532245 n=1 Tax=Bacillus rossius redtenbacheri TaxID=93214 RepID=UPI002FDEC06C